MKILVKREELIAALEKVKGAVPTKTSLPITGNYFLEAKNGRVAVTGYNLDVALTADCKAKIIKAGKMLLSPRTLPLLKAIDLDIIGIGEQVKVHKYEETDYEKDPNTGQYLKDEAGQIKPRKVQKERREYAVCIEAGTSTASFGSHDWKDYPVVPHMGGKYPVVFTDLATSLKRMSFAASREDNRPTLQGVCFTPGKKEMELAAADGFRLAITGARYQGKMDKTIIVPATACELFARMMPGKVEATVALSTDNEPGIIHFRQKGLTMAIRLISGNFPQYAQLVPKGGTWLRCAADPLRKALRQLAVIRPVNNAVRFETKGHNLTVSRKEDDQVIEVKMPAKGKGKVSINMEYVKDLLDRMDGTFAIRVQKEEGRPVVSQVDHTTIVTMPLAFQK